MYYLLLLQNSSGYEYSYPFLGEGVGITVKDYSVEPLYKHILNIKHPTMAFIGVSKIKIFWLISLLIFTRSVVS